MPLQKYKHAKPFITEQGGRLQELEIAYQTYGTLNAAGDNAVWVCHALTGNTDAEAWWPGLIGPGCLYNADEYFIICANVPGSPYGSTNPLSVNPVFKQPYYLSFPQLTIRDMVKALQLLAKHLGIHRVHTLIGGSMGGMQALEWAVMAPDFTKNLVLLACNARHSAWGIAFNESQRMAIEADRTFYANSPAGGAKGLAAARSIALLSYRSYDAYKSTESNTTTRSGNKRNACTYQQHQGQKLVKRFNAYSYWYLSKALDSHDTGRGRKGTEQALAAVKAKTLVMGITGDVNFPLCEQEYLAKHIPGAALQVINSVYGHDGFLLETEQISQAISNFYNNNTQQGHEMARAV